MKVAVNGLAVSSAMPGLGRMTWQSVQALLEHVSNVEVHLLLPADAPSDLDLSHPRLHAVPTEYSLEQDLPTEPVRAPSVAELTGTSIDVYYAPSYLLPQFSGAGAEVHGIHDLAWRMLPASKSEVFRSYINLRFPAVFERADRLVCVSHATRNDLLKQFGHDLEERVRVVPHGVDLDRYEPALDSGSSSFVAVVGSYDSRRQAKTLLEAFPVFRARMRPCRMVVVGPDSADAAKPPAVDFLGHLDEDELASLYQRALMVVQPTHYEGSGLPILDAMACGTPVACADIAVFREIAGEAAHYFDPYDASSIARAMDRLARDEALRATLSQRGLERAREFPWEASARRLASVFEEVAS